MEEVKNVATLSEKLVDCADREAAWFRSRRGEEARLPASIRLLYSAAKNIDMLNAQLVELKDQAQALTRILSEQASCETCKSGPAKKCGVRSECSEDRTLWDLKDPTGT